MLSLTGSMAALLFMQAAPMRPVQPWDGEPQVLICTLVGQKRQVEEYVLTITATHAFIVGQTPGQAIRMEQFIPFTNLGIPFRRDERIRQLQFLVGEQAASVRQHYKAGELQSTFLSLDPDMSEPGILPFETFAGFCAPAGDSKPN